MSAFEKATDLAKELFEMGVEFRLFKEQVLRLEAKEAELRERVARLESELSGVKEAAASEARSAAHAGVYELQAHLVERITRLEERTQRLGTTGGGDQLT